MNNTDLKIFAEKIIDTFDDFLTDKGIVIENYEKDDPYLSKDEVTNIYGTDYGNLEDNIIDITNKYFGIKYSDIPNVIDTEKGVSKEEIKDYTVEEIINILSKYPKNYRFLCMGYEEGFSAIVDHDNGMISIDLNDFADQLVNTFKEKN